jgi:hypothetical protein
MPSWQRKHRPIRHQAPRLPQRQGVWSRRGCGKLPACYRTPCMRRILRRKKR